MTINWTESQRQAIRHSGTSALVSAAAGSGKTAVLAERCAYLVCDAPDPCDVDQLLVVTFTESAAAEMRERIHKFLSQRAETSSDPRLLRQLALVAHAHIGTIHSFCSRLVRQNFSIAGVDPQFKVIDPDEAMLLRRDVARDLFDSRYESPDSVPFASLIDAYCDGDDQRLIDLVSAAHEMLASLPQPIRWLETSRKTLADAAAKPLAQSSLGKLLLKDVQSALDRLLHNCQTATQTLRKLRLFPDYEKRLNQWTQQAADWKDLFAAKGLDALVKAVKEFEADRLPAVKTGTPNKEQAKSIVDSIKEQMRAGDLSELLAFDESQWRQGQKDILPFADCFLDLVAQFSARYSHAKRSIGGVDFSDLERLALNVLSDDDGPSPVARACHRQYLHVLVDEYQDVNDIQDAILRRVSAECVHHEGQFPPNLFTVGDVKQSVYRFRLAEPRLFLNRQSDFLKKNAGVGRVINLQENFRSRSPLLDSINEVFARLMTAEAAEIEYDQTHYLRPPAGREPDSGPSAVELHLLPHSKSRKDELSSDADLERNEYEALFCAKIIKELTSPEGGYQFGDIAILLRSLKFKADDYVDMLARHGIPVHSSGGASFFDATEIRDMFALLSLLDNQQQDVPLAAFLRSPLANLPDPDDSLAAIRLAFSKDKTPFHQSVLLFAQRQDEQAARLREVLSQVSRWRDVARQRPLGELIWTVYQQTGYLTYVAGLEAGSQRVANLLHLHQRARQFGSFLKQGLYRFISFLNQLREETELPRPSLALEDRNAVQLMSIHKAKGLEFKVVLLPDLGRRHYSRDAEGSILLDRRGSLGMKVVDQASYIRYPSLSWQLAHNSLHRQTLAEELRLLYVAMTRAKERLIMIATAGEKAAANWSLEYAGHVGPLPTEKILGSHHMLDWLGPVHAACGDQTIKLIPHAAEELQSLSTDLTAKSAAPRRADLAALSPLDPPPPMTETARAAIARLEFIYPHQSATTIAAAQAPTAAEGLPRLTPSPCTQGEGWGGGSPQTALSAALIGEATHLVLEHLDYSRPCDLPDVRAQIQSLIARQLLPPAHAAAVDLDAVVWLATTELGKTLRANPDSILREIPFAYADSPDSPMIRGRIDLIVPDGDGLILADYKTDRVTIDTVAECAAHYARQLTSYRDVLSRVAGKKVTAIHLVFLHPRHIHRLELPA